MRSLRNDKSILIYLSRKMVSYKDILSRLCPSLPTRAILVAVSLNYAIKIGS